MDTVTARPSVFVSYNQADRPWAEWIAWTLEENGYKAVVQAWDIRTGSNFVLEMHTAAAECTTRRSEVNAWCSHCTAHSPEVQAWCSHCTTHSPEIQARCSHCTTHSPEIQARCSHSTT